MSKLVKRIYYGIRLALETPLCISNGENELTDCDIIRTWDGEPFVPGTSFAGACRAFCDEMCINKNSLFGESEDKGKMSRLWFSDFYFDSIISSSIRDGVELKEKVAVKGAKYDYEILEYGSGVLYIQLCIWDGMDELAAEKVVQQIIGGINRGDIRLGAQKNRGLGKLRVKEVYKCAFSSENVNEWIDFTREKLITDVNKEDFHAWSLENNRYVTIKVPLELTGGLSIRQYSTKVNEPDFVSLMRKTDTGKEHQHPVIPGSSWKGAIKSRVWEIMRELEIEKELEKSSLEIFGYVDRNNNQTAKASDMIISESVLEENGFICSIRNRISRFENATVQGNLYQERCAVQGKTELEIKVKKLVKETDWFIGLLLLAVKDIQKGYLAIGGGSAIGRGIFEEGGKIEIISGLSEKEYIQALRRKLVR